MKTNRAEEYSLDSLDPGVDRDKAKEFLEGGDKSAQSDDDVSDAHIISTYLSQDVEDPELLVSRTIRLRASTDEALSHAWLQQKLKKQTPNTVQEIVDAGVRIILHQLGYLDRPD